jgi:hypothetical protein
MNPSSLLPLLSLPLLSPCFIIHRLYIPHSIIPTALEMYLNTLLSAYTSTLCHNLEDQYQHLLRSVNLKSHNLIEDC